MEYDEDTSIVCQAYEYGPLRSFLFPKLLVCYAAQVTAWLTTSDRKYMLSPLGPIAGRDADGASCNGPVVEVNPTAQHQTLRGFGAALTNAAAYLIYHRPNTEQYLNALFSTQSGIGLSYVRIAIGGTDFQAVEPYTYNDLTSGETDFSLDHFSLEADKEFIIPVLKKIKAVNPAVRFLATPWSAPAWMKENPENATLFGGTLSSRPEVLQSYANFFVKFLQAYEAEGIPIDLVTVQNEPGHGEDTYPTMMMSAELQTKFIKLYLGPTLRANYVNTGIVIYDHNWDNIAFPLQILSDPEAKAFINGTAFHCYAGSSTAPRGLYKKHPDVSIYFTECSGGIWDRTFSSAISWEVKHLLMDQTRSGAKMVLLWNMALDGNYGPKVGVGGCEKCRGVISIYEDGGFRKEAEYYSLGHFSKFVFPGANRTDSENFSDRSLETAAYVNVDGSVVAVVLNTHDKRSRSFCLKLYGKTYQYENLPLQSVVTFVYTPATQNP